MTLWPARHLLRCEVSVCRWPAARHVFIVPVKKQKLNLSLHVYWFWADVDLELSSWQCGEFVTCDCLYRAPGRWGRGVFILCSVALRRRSSAVLALDEPPPSFYPLFLFSSAAEVRSTKLLPVSTQGEGRHVQRIMSQFGIELLSLCGICLI